jgi:retron-type reverse transcriptase
MVNAGETNRSSFCALKRDAAPAVDGVPWTEYETGLGERLKDLHSRVHRGTYRAQPSKRAYIPKADGRQRPLEIAALEDKIVQHAVMTVLNLIYEATSSVSSQLIPREEGSAFACGLTATKYPMEW